jgi:hypothetical protein
VFRRTVPELHQIITYSKKEKWVKAMKISLPQIVTETSSQVHSKMYSSLNMPLMLSRNISICSTHQPISTHIFPLSTFLIVKSISIWVIIDCTMKSLINLLMLRKPAIEQSIPSWRKTWMIFHLSTNPLWKIYFKLVLTT